jgi:UPF0716 protein FxsA
MATAKTPTMRLVLLLMLIAFPLLELALLIKLVQLIGFGLTCTVIFLTAMLGIAILYLHGFGALSRAVAAAMRRELALEPLGDSVWLMLAGMLLLAPGLITDTLGLLLLMRPLRRSVANFTRGRILRAARQPGDGTSPAHTAPPTDGPIIDGEFVRLDETTVDRHTVSSRH